MQNTSYKDQDINRKDKKKKHYRSRSRSEHKRRKHSRSRSQKKKDKKKKQYDRYKRSNSSNSQEKITSSKYLSEYKQKDKKKQQDKQKDKNLSKQKYRDKSKQRKKDKYQKRSISKEKSKERQQKKQKQRKQKQKQREIQKQKQKQRQKQKQKQKQKQRQKQKQKQKDKGRQKQRQRQRDRDNKYDKYDKYERYDRYQKQRKDRKQRSRERFRSKQRDQKKQKDRKADKYRRRSRSKSRDQRRRDRRRDTPKFRFDSPPKSHESDMSNDPQKMQKLNRMKAQKQLVTSKADRKLYLGNLPPNITSQQLMDMLNTALKKMQINTQTQGDSIVSAWISPDGVGHYAFVQFRTAQQASNGLTLNGASLFGYQLKLGRPKQYIQYNKQLLSQYGTDSSIDTIIKKVHAIGGQTQFTVQQKIICPPTHVIILKHIVTVQQLAIDQQYEQILDDVKQMAKRFGDMKKVIIPRPHQVIDLQQVQKRVKGLGYIFIEYKTVQQAIFARKQFIQKQFSNRSVACSFFDQERFKQGEYDINEKVIIDF